MSHRSTLALVLLLAAGCGATSESAPLPPATGSQSAPLPQLPSRIPMSTTVGVTASTTRTTGTLTARTEVAIAPRAAGTLVELKLAVGDKVTRGDVVFRVDGADAALRVQQARTQLRGAQAQLANTRLEHERARSLFDQNAATQQQWQQAQAKLELGEVEVAQARNAVASAEKAVADTTVRAPISGIVSAKLLEVGEYAGATPPTTVLVLQDQATLELKFRLPDQVLATVRVGAKLDVDITALGLERQAIITLVSPAVDTASRTIELTAVLDNRDGALRPGMMAEVAMAPLALTGSQP